MTKSRVGRRPDGPEDANPMNRRLPAEVVSRRKGNEQRVGPGKGAKEEAAPSNVPTDLKQVLAMKPDARVKWLARAVQQAHPQDGRLAPKSIYDIIAHAKFANDVSEKSGQRMYRVVHANLSLFSTRQQKFLEKECALAKQFAASAFSAAQAEDEDKTAAAMEDMMARCRAFVRERQSERGERNDKEGNDEGEQDEAEAAAEPADLQTHAEPLEPSEPRTEDAKVVTAEATVPAREASKSRSDGGDQDHSQVPAVEHSEPQEEKSPIKVKGITEKIAEAAKAEDAKEREAKAKKDKVKGKIKGKSDKNGYKDKDAASVEDKPKSKAKTREKDRKSRSGRKKQKGHSAASSSGSNRDRSKSRSRSHRRDAKRKMKGKSNHSDHSSDSARQRDRDDSESRHKTAKKSGKAKGKSHHSSDSSDRKRRRSTSSSRSRGKRRK